MKVVLFTFRDGKKREFPVNGATTVIGRRPDAGLRIPAGDVSRQHCELHLGNGALLVKDLGSANGTYVNGKRIAEQKLSAGDRLAVGPVLFIVQIDGNPARITEADLQAAPTPAPAPKVKADSKAKGDDKGKGGAGKAAVAAGVAAGAAGLDDENEDDIFELGETDFDLDDPITALEELEDEDDLP